VDRLYLSAVVVLPTATGSRKPLSREYFRRLAEEAGSCNARFPVERPAFQASFNFRPTPGFDRRLPDLPELSFSSNRKTKTRQYAPGGRQTAPVSVPLRGFQIRQKIAFFAMSLLVKWL